MIETISCKITTKKIEHLGINLTWNIEQGKFFNSPEKHKSRLE